MEERVKRSDMVKWDCKGLQIQDFSKNIIGFFLVEVVIKG
ncbi:protein of unknown function [Candidatus Methylacidiphilum fumarolicum]|uniref:Uncharacterized protein n=1 Tax=Candidatus Methylacidiphilum fumarolicum TaxID=591154 RepID=A0ABN8XIG9_9BACT|nr:protein of unknown function [Candidatus Methylacidiphilum fumarolicum]